MVCGERLLKFWCGVSPFVVRDRHRSIGIFQRRDREGGEPGRNGETWLHAPGEPPRSLGKLDLLRPPPRATLAVCTAGGGGYGHPYDRDPELVLFDGSGAALPPVATDRRILVAGAHQPPELVTGYLNAFRILLSDLIVLTMAEEGSGWQTLRDAIADVKDVPVVPTVLRPRPVEDVSGRRVAFFTTAPGDALDRVAAHLRDEHGAELVHVSGNLSRRAELRADLASLEARSADLYLVELKAAAIDVVAETAAERGVPVVLCDNEVRAVEGETELDERILDLAESLAGVEA